MKSSVKMLFGALAALVFLTVPETFGQQTDNDRLNQGVSDLAMRGTVDQILSRVARLYDLPIGLKVALQERNTQSEQKIDINIRDGSVRTVLDTIVAAYPQYKWEENDGVVNVIPREDLDDLLSTAIREFKICQQTRINLRQSLFDLPEVKLKLERMGVQSLNVELLSGLPKMSFHYRPSFCGMSLLRMR